MPVAVCHLLASQALHDAMMAPSRKHMLCSMLLSTYCTKLARRPYVRICCCCCWHACIPPLPGASSWSLAPDKSGLSEVLNVAWAGHEIVSDSSNTMLDFFEQQQAAQH
jgi:hypothetical protein